MENMRCKVEVGSCIHLYSICIKYGYILFIYRILRWGNQHEYVCRSVRERDRINRVSAEIQCILRLNV